MLGVLLVSMTTGTGSVKIPGANGTGGVGVTPKEDTHNYRWIDRQSGKSEVCKQKNTHAHILFYFIFSGINKVSLIKYYSSTVNIVTSLILFVIQGVPFLGFPLINRKKHKILKMVCFASLFIFFKN